jgi:hypothetical protein
MSGRRARFTLAFASTVVLAAVLMTFTGARTLFHAGVLVLGAVAFLPALLVLAFLAAVAVAALFAALVGGEAGAADLPVTDLPASKGWIRRYYRTLLAQRHPVVLGCAAGLAAATVACALWVALVIVPQETRTVALLIEARIAVERLKARSGRYPEPGPHSELSVHGTVARDGFGRPLIYSVKGPPLLRQYRVLSLGHDGVPGGDDLCVEGGSRLTRWMAALASLERVLEILRPGSVPQSQSFAAVETLRCLDEEG